MTGSNQISRYNDDQCEIIWDRRYLPYLMSHVRGKLTMPAIDYYFNERNRLLQEFERSGGKVITINDMSAWEVPPATVRKALGERAKEDENVKSILMYLNVVPNPMLRGVITAINWVTGTDKLQPVKVAASLTEADRIARAAFREAGITDVPDLSTYSLPDA